MAVGSSQKETRLPLAAVAPTFERLRELHRGQRLATFVEHYGDCAGCRLRYLAAAVRQLGHFARPGDPLQIALDQIGFR